MLVSEVMLQQTQVERVVEAYRRFMSRFPTLETLAAAQTEEVLHAFSGLGYYRRARLLHEAARAIAGRGAWPKSSRELEKLPGFGPYTSAAVAAFSFGGTEPPVDGNVARVTARLHALELPLGSPALLAAGRTLARTLHSQTGTPEVWEALMELGATVCTPVSPRCGSCPLSGDCAALAGGAPAGFPLPRPKRAREGQTWVALWLLRDDGRVLLRRVDDGGLLGGMWLPPFEMVPDGTDLPGAARALAHDAGYRVPLRPASPVRHGITHRDILVVPFAGRTCATRVAEPGPGWRWEDPCAPAVPTSTLLAKLAHACAPASQEE